MAYTVANLKTDLQGILHGTTNNQIAGLDPLINRAARQVLLDCDPNETIRIAPISSNIYQQVYDYPLPSDLKGTRVIDILPQVNRGSTEVFNQIYNQPFDLKKGINFRDQMSILFNSGVKIIRLDAQSLTAPTQLNDVSSISGNGTWAVGGNAASLAVDSVNYVSVGASLSFNLSAGANPSTGYLENSTQTAVDLSSMKNQGALFLWTYLPTGSDFSNINLRWGSSSSNYYSVNATVNQDNVAFVNGWNLIKFSWLGATVTGTPTDTAINYLRVTWTYNGTLETSVRLDYIFAALGSIFNIEYYSKYLFRTSGGTWAETETNDTDIINLDTESYNLLMYKVAEYAVQEMQGLNAMFYDGPYFEKLYNETLSRYVALYKSQVQKPQQTYYRMPTPQNRTLPIRRGF